METDRIIFEDIAERHRAELEAIIAETAYISEWTGWEEEDADPAGTIIANEDLPRGGTKDRSRRCLLRCKADGGALGLMAWYEGAPGADCVFLGQLMIRPASQGKGYGAEAVRAALTAWKDAGFRRSVLNVGARNLPALRFWIECGYRGIDRIIDYKPGFFDLRLGREL